MNLKKLYCGKRLEDDTKSEENEGLTQEPLWEDFWDYRL